MPVPEKRRYVRIHFNRQVQLDFSTEVYDNCQVMDISLGGMYINGKFPHKIEDQCYINLVQTSRKIYLTFQALAKIVRHDDNGIGLEFVSMSFESLLSLEMILLYEPREDSSDTEIVLPEDVPFEISEETYGIPDKLDPV